MKYKYIFHSPVIYSIISDDADYQEVQKPASQLKIPNIIELANKVLHNKTNRFITLMNNKGIIDIQFNIINDTLTTIAVIDHCLRIDEFKKLYTDIQSQLMAGLGKTISEIPLLRFNDNIEYINKQGIKEYKPVIKQIYCLLWQYDNWKLKFISDRR